MSIDRRQFLTRSGLGVASAVVGMTSGIPGGGTDEPAGASGSSSGADSDQMKLAGLATLPIAAQAHDPYASMPAVPFHGPHQAGIVNPPPPAAVFVAMDVIATGRDQLEDLLRTITTRARFLTVGGTPPNFGKASPPSDSGMLGPVVPADGLTITLGVSSSMFDDRFGLDGRMPIHLTPMEPFPNDDLNPTWTDGDLLLQICAGSQDTALHALRDIAKHTRGGMQVRWRMDGYHSPLRPNGVARNNLGFMDGIANPAVEIPDVAQQLLWVEPGSGEPDWAVGGSYHAVRLIRMFIEFWDRVSLTEQQAMFGRYKASGAPIGMKNFDDLPDYTDDPYGLDVPLTSHIRVANPRTPATEPNRIYRRSYNYDLGTDINGNLDMGHVFTCFQQNLTRQFKVVQTRLNNEALTDYVSPFGGNYFFTLPGAHDESDWLGRGLLDA